MRTSSKNVITLDSSSSYVDSIDLNLLLRGRYVLAKDVPMTTWVDLKPYWPVIAKSIIEVFIEG